MMAICVVVLGCGRRFYRVRADVDAYALVNEKSVGTPWQIPRSYSVYPDPDSRLADPTDPDFPLLPSPGPILYSGEMPPSLERDGTQVDEEELPEGEELPNLEQPPASLEAPLPEPPRIQVVNPLSDMRRLPRVITRVEQTNEGVRLASFQAPGDQAGLPAPLPPTPTDTESSSTAATDSARAGKFMDRPARKLPAVHAGI